jgi:uncharacterized repeat protein (TIGR03803 family)
MLAFAAVLTQPVHAQNYQVIHNFTGGLDGERPFSTLIIDGGGNLYGSAGNTVFKMTYRGSGWVLNPLYIFTGGLGGEDPLQLVFGPDGSLYGPAGGGGNPYCNCGLVFRLRPSPTSPRSVLNYWNETVLYTFTGGGGDGAYPDGGLIFDQAGNIYGTTMFGGSYFGTAYELTPSPGQWTETILQRFPYPTNGPYSGVIRDGAGNLYGTTGDGTVVYELSPTSSGWVLSVLHTFTGGTGGNLAYGGLVMDPAGDLYGNTATGGTGGGGVVFELSPYGNGWTFQILHNFEGGEGPFNSLALDGAGNLYGTTFASGVNGAGSVFELSPSGGSWTFTDLHDFSFKTEWFPEGGVTLDAHGNLYGTTEQGGAYGHGVVWEITP